ncbi:MerR family transcriptional regulator [Moorena sp. SIO3H5]|nr:MerR family transcriptional regulator [Moorena sp. SIO3H5]
MHYRPHEFAKIAGVTVRTLQRWDISGKLVYEQV